MKSHICLSQSSKKFHAAYEMGPSACNVYRVGLVNLYSSDDKTKPFSRK